MRISAKKFEAELARQMKGIRDLKGVSTNALTNARKGKEMSPKTAGKIAAALGVDITELMED